MKIFGGNPHLHPPRDVVLVEEREGYSRCEDVWLAALRGDRQCALQGSFDLLRKRQQEKVTSRIEIILARLIDDAKVIFFLGLLIWQDQIKLANYQIFAILILETECKSDGVCTLHRLNPETA